MLCPELLWLETFRFLEKDDLTQTAEVCFGVSGNLKLP